MFYYNADTSINEKFDKTPYLQKLGKSCFEKGMNDEMIRMYVRKEKIKSKIILKAR